MGIPKILHFIWVGQAMLDERIANVKNWARLNPSFKVYLWLDKIGDQRNSIFGNAYTNSVKVTSEKFALSSDTPNNIELRDVDALSKIDAYFNECVRFEIDKLRPNYGSASDLLRLLILDNFGGAYYDSDVSAFPLDKLKIWNTENGFYMHKKSYNDIIVCNKNSPILREFMVKIKENYLQASSPIKQILYDTYLSDNPLYIIFRTIDKTGPSITNLINGNKEIKELAELRNYRSNAESHQSWCGRGVKKLNNINDIQRLIEIIIHNIIFELKSTKILRMEDHVYAFLESIDEDDPKEGDNYLKAFFEKVKVIIPIDDVEYAQLTFHHPEVFIFYQSNNLLSRTLLLPWDYRHIRAHDVFSIYQSLSNIYTQNTIETHGFIRKFKNCCNNTAEALQHIANRILPKMTQSLYLDDFSDYLDFAATYINNLGMDDSVKAMLVDLKKIIDAKLKFLDEYKIKLQFWSEAPMFVKLLEEQIQIYNHISLDVKNLQLKITKDDYYLDLQEKSLLGDGADDEKAVEFFEKIFISEATKVPMDVVALIQGYAAPTSTNSLSALNRKMKKT